MEENDSRTWEMMLVLVIVLVTYYIGYHDCLSDHPKSMSCRDCVKEDY